MQKQMQENTTADLGLLRGELNILTGRISDLEEAMSSKVSVVAFELMRNIVSVSKRSKIT